MNKLIVFYFIRKHGSIQFCISIQHLRIQNNILDYYKVNNTETETFLEYYKYT